MHLDYFGLAKPPFAVEPDTDVFFQEAERTKLLRRIYAELQSGTPIVRLTGAEGTGKTLLCLLLARLLPAEYQVACLSSPAGSFDELLHAVCGQLDCQPESDMPAWLHKQLTQCQTQGKRLLLIIDQAEKMFPAALERLLRTVFAVADQQQPLQVILVGRPALNDRIEQLQAYCPDMNIQPGHLLEPLTEAELAAYLSFRIKAAGLAEEDSSRAFSAEATRQIFTYSKGSLLTAHLLADQALQRICTADRYFPVQAADVPPFDSKGRQKQRQAARSGNTVKLLAAFLLLLFAVLLFRYSGALRQNGQDAARNLVSPVPVKPESLLPDKVKLTSEPELPQEIETVEEADPPAAEQADAAASNQEVPPPTVHEQQEIQSLPVQEETGAELPEELLDTPPPAETQTQTAPAVVPAPAPLRKIVELVPGMRKTKLKPKEQPVPPPPPLAPEPPPERPAVERAAVPSADQLYQEMLAAGSLLQRSRNSDRYTIQLMKLTSADGGARLKELLVRDEYLELRSQLKLLRSPNKELVVFYGSYPNMEAAKAAVDSMPLFLRKQYHPTNASVLPVAEALSRTGN